MEASDDDIFSMVDRSRVVPACVAVRVARGGAQEVRKSKWKGRVPNLNYTNKSSMRAIEFWQEASGLHLP